MMKWNNVSQLTRDGSYTVDQPLRYLVESVQRYIDEYGLDLDADFQRGHVWTPDQQSRYVEFLLRGGQSSRLLYFNCVGWMRDMKGPFFIVDGKQRLTACLKFMQNEVLAFGHRFSEFEGNMDTMITLRFNINNLATRAEVLQWYLDLNSGGVVHTTEELDRVRKLLEQEKKHG
jgi:hypothetical protein